MTPSLLPPPPPADSESAEHHAQNTLQQDLKLTYEMALTVLFRLLFIAYAEDRDLLPYKTNEAYRRRSLKETALELARAVSTDSSSRQGGYYWAEISQLFSAISEGNDAWGVPAYNGTIFSSDQAVSKAGAELDRIAVDNSFFEEALRAFLLVESEDKIQAPVDFRALSVREFGTIYEGLLESELAYAEQDLACGKDGSYRPVKAREKVIVQAGEVYLHDRSGARRSSGSYYTPDILVDHLLDTSLEPALDEHLKSLDKLGEADRAERFFDFRVADIAMGSGHFLVAAIDRIERRFALWLEANPTPGIALELNTLRVAARKELRDSASQTVIEDGQLLRRMIARRCIYGVDLNPLAVQLTRLSVWIHTFVPGLPLSLLDHNLTEGDSLIGVGSLGEIRDKFSRAKGTLFEVDAEKLLGQAREPLSKLARLLDTSIEDIEVGRRLIKEARRKTTYTEALCDLITAHPLAKSRSCTALKDFPFWEWEKRQKGILKSKELKQAQEILSPVSVLHFPIAFPEVFLGRHSGFNVVLGNPPWKVPVEEEGKFWTRYMPGLKGLPQREREARMEEIRKKRPDLVRGLEEGRVLSERIRDFLKAGNFPGTGKGNPDLHKAFAWRFWFVASEKVGRIGVVLPRSALVSLGSAGFRKRVFAARCSLDIITLQNSGQWVFNIEDRYVIALVSISRPQDAKDAGTITLKGPFTSEKAFLDNKEDPAKDGRELAVCIPVSEVLGWNESASLPNFPVPYPLSLEVFRQMRKAPDLGLNKPDGWRARPDRELDATSQKPLMDLKSKDCPDGYWKVYKGESFDLWQPDIGIYYAWADPNKVLPWLQQKRQRASRNANSTHSEFSQEFIEDESTLAACFPRIAFRDIARSTDNRTVICALIPPKTFITHKGPVFLFPRGDKKDEAYLLGVLSSIVFDWYARRIVEINLTFYLLNQFPIPRPKRIDPLWKRAVSLAGRLACPDERFADWAHATGVRCGALPEKDKLNKIYELDAVVAHLYGLSEKHLQHIFDTFHEKKSFDQARQKGVLEHYRAWAEKLGKEAGEVDSN